MSSVFVLERILVGGEGKSAIPIAAAVFATEEAAKEAKALRERELADFLSCMLVRQVGPSQGTYTGLTAEAFLTGIGINGFEHVVQEAKVTEKTLIAVPVPKLIIPP